MGHPNQACEIDPVAPGSMEAWTEAVYACSWRKMINHGSFCQGNRSRDSAKQAGSLHCLTCFPQFAHTQKLTGTLTHREQQNWTQQSSGLWDVPVIAGFAHGCLMRHVLPCVAQLETRFL